MSWLLLLKRCKLSNAETVLDARPGSLSVVVQKYKVKTWCFECIGDEGDSLIWVCSVCSHFQVLKPPRQAVVGWLGGAMIPGRPRKLNGQLPPSGVLWCLEAALARGLFTAGSID